MLGSVPTMPGGRVPLPLRLAATPGVGDLMVRAVKPGRRMLLRMMASMGEAETIVRHPELLDSLVAGARDPVATQANLAELRALITWRGFRPSMRFSHEELRRLSVPTLMIWGDNDPVVPLAQARAVAAGIPGARLEVVPAGHAPQLGQPDRVAALLEEFALQAESDDRTRRNVIDGVVAPLRFAAIARSAELLGTLLLPAVVDRRSLQQHTLLPKKGRVSFALAPYGEPSQGRAPDPDPAGPGRAFAPTARGTPT